MPDRQEAILAALQACPLYFILDESLLATYDPVNLTQEVVQAGVRMLQLRLKITKPSELLQLAKTLREITCAASCILIINDDLDIACECGADGVHLGADDTSIAEARRNAPELIVGATARTPEAGWQAELDGADYVGCGSVFASSTKAGLQVVGLDGLAAVNKYISIPVIGIGGITPENAPAVLATGVAGICSVAPFRTGAPNELVRQFKRE